MSTDERTPSIAHYRFLPWVRQGFQPSGRTDAAADAGETVDGDASTAVTLTAQANEDADGEVTPTDAVDATVDLRLYGPGDVVGIDHRQLVRTEPTADTPDFLPNRFPFVEFDRPDLPWLFSPVGPDDDGRLRPWCVLVVVRQQEGVTLGMDEDATVPVLEIAAPADPGEELPPLRDAWAWAHVQVLGDPASLYDDEWLRTELAGQSDATVARLLAPRKLASGETYHACVVPAYEAGRLAGLGAGGAEATTGEFAWSDDDATVRLPVYHRWEFSTGRSGDFEALARRLDPTLLPPTVGSRDLDVSDPGPDELALAGDDPAATLALGGALTAPERDPPTYDPALQATLSDVLNAPATEAGSDDDGDATTAGDTGDGNAAPVVGPPTYGEWHAPVDPLGAPGAGSGDAADDGGWVRELNLNPHHRAAAGFGTRVVQGEQEELMASAWAQLGDIRRANRLLRAAQRSREASRGLHADLFAGTPAASVGVTGPVHPKLLHDDRTVAAAVDESRLPAAAIDPVFRRLLRAGGAVAGASASAPDPAAMVDALNDGTASGDPNAGSAPAPDGTASMGDVAATLCDAAGRRLDYLDDLASTGDSYVDTLVDAIEAREAALETVPVIPIDVVDTDGTVATISGATITAFGFDSVTIDLSDGGGSGDAGGDDGSGSDGRSVADTGTTSGTSSPTAGGGAGTPVIDVPTDPPDHDDPDDPSDPDGETPSERRDRLERERRILVAELGRVSRGRDPGALATALEPVACATDDTGIDSPGDALPLADIASTVETALDPAATIPARVTERIDGVDEDALLGRGDALAPLVAIPEFPRPMYEGLRDRSADLLLPGVESIPRDSLGVLTTNPAFVEAYMTGVNHEMAREFRWREYPTVSWGTYFRQFWDARGRVPAPETPEEIEAARDIDPIRQWNDGLPLGGNAVLKRLLGDDPEGTVPAGDVTAGAEDGAVVLIVRGELLRRYPTAVVYAVPAAVAVDDAGDVVVDPATGEPVRRPTTASTAPATPDEDGDDGPAGPAFPAFRGTIDPDITFLGFDLGIDAARGDPPADLTATSGDPGWFLVIEEAPGEPAFGLDRDPGATPQRPPSDSWNDLAWEHLLADPDAGGYAAAGDGPVEGVRIGAVEWGHNAAHQAYATWQRPARIAVHASELLPPDADDPTDGGETA